LVSACKKSQNSSMPGPQCSMRRWQIFSPCIQDAGLVELHSPVHSNVESKLLLHGSTSLVMALDLRSQRQPCTGAHRPADGANSPLDLRLRATQPGRCSVLGAGSIPRWDFTWHSRRAAELSIFLAHIVAAGKGTGVLGNFVQRSWKDQPGLNFRHACPGHPD
jgi:hypothetical protein